MALFLADEQDLDLDADDLQLLAASVLRDRRVPDDMEVSVLFVDRDTIADLNAHHLGGDGPTDVLAFPIDLPGEAPPDAPAVLGDVVVCPTVARDQAPRFGRSYHEELQLLVVHGLLHLLGMDHDGPDEERAMFGLTDRLLAAHRSAPARPRG